MLFPLLGRHLVHSMVVLYTALVCTSIFHDSLLGMSAIPDIKSDCLVVPKPALADANTWQNEAIGAKKKTTKNALALLYPPGLSGGYRNQVMRLIGFLHYAKVHDVEEILLPTMLWSKCF